MTTALLGRFCEVRAFRPEDYVLATATSPGWRPDDPLAMGREHARTGASFSAWLDDGLLACAGLLVPGWPGLGMAWAVLTPLGRAHPVMIHRTAKAHLRAVARQHGLRRVEAKVFPAHRRAVAWIEALGFEAEAVHPRWGPEGETAITYVWFPEVGHATDR